MCKITVRDYHRDFFIHDKIMSMPMRIPYRESLSIHCALSVDIVCLLEFDVFLCEFLNKHK